ncbi:hypothetical protein [Clostridium cellulovorans]|uniref:Uncharacterized protein n=1 Tax=Clostridium cellulovorans (strain ATCC 35296 / DSM 3052 / OCM 3 / 743B) TaxID=573061 RepID=D9SS07_CLOC7|nr:hypothetical protein [Clostridium cellulovorans]ADL52454.1 hypothetical protein Clocel_2757 [Clostridium cellulovorans 743B]
MEENNSDMNTYQKEYEKYYYSLQKQIEDDKKKNQEDYENYNYKDSKRKNTKHDINEESEKIYIERGCIDKDFEDETYNDLAISEKIYKREKEKKSKNKIDRFIFQLGITFFVMAFYVGTAYISPPIFNVVKSYTQKYCSSHELEYENLISRYNSINWQEIESYFTNNYNYFKNEIRSLL